MTKTQDCTKQVIAEMLTARVGTSILDSGGTPRYDEDGNYIGSTGGYGRHFERNQLRDFEVEDRASVEFWVGSRTIYGEYGTPEQGRRVGTRKELDVGLSRNVYWFLEERLEYAEEWDEFFHAWANERDSHWLADMEAFPEYLQKRGFKVGGLYGDGNPFVVNTYNHESAVSQVLQFLYMTVTDVPEEHADKLEWGTVILLQIHNGADVRGGYTAPRAFFEVEDVGMLTDNDGWISCEEGHGWYTDDAGYSWYPNNAEKALKEYPPFEMDDPDLIEQFEKWRIEMGYDQIEPIPEGQPPLTNFPDGAHRRLEVNECAQADIKRYIIEELGGVPVEDHKAYCPICGEILSAW